MSAERNRIPESQSCALVCSGLFLDNFSNLGSRLAGDYSKGVVCVLPQHHTLSWEKHSGQKADKDAPKTDEKRNRK
jgi:hypothetical protein